jgi:hypothetical protein
MILRSKMQLFTQPSGSMNHHNTAATVTSDYLMLGGGAWDDWDYTGGYGNLLVSSYPSGARTWFVEGKDHRRADPSVIHVAVIGIQNISFPNVGYLDADTRFNDNNYYQTGYDYVDRSISSLYAFTCGGGQCAYTGSGRMIVELWPYANSEVRFANRDMTNTDADIFTAYLRELRVP